MHLELLERLYLYLTIVVKEVFVSQFKKVLIGNFCTIILLVAMSGCSIDDSAVSILKKSDSPYRILGDTIINSDLTIEAGVIIEIADSVSIVFNGDLIIKGTEQDRVVFSPIDNNWDGLILNGLNKKFEAEYTSMSNGKVLCQNLTRVNLKNVSFLNSADLNYWEGLFVMNAGGEFNGDSISMVSNFAGEGFVLSGLKSANLTNSYFENVNDSFELFGCNKGAIYKCVFKRSTYDDAIDLNGCENILIQDNLFSHIGQDCIEVGEDTYYNKVSSNILVVNNTIVRSNIGLHVQESSDVITALNSFSDCQFTIELDSSSNSVQNYNSVIVNSSIIKTVIKENNVGWFSCVSDVELKGVGNCLINKGDIIDEKCDLPGNAFTEAYGLSEWLAGALEESSVYNISKIKKLKRH